jgi:hypothetical protein
MEKELKFRDCGDCNECCKWLIVDDIHGHDVKPGKPCFYLCEEKNCTIHEQRPEVCRNYQCAWSQGILPIWMKPNKSNAVINVEKWGPNKEYQLLRVTETGKKYDTRVLSWLINFCQKLNTPIIYEVEGGWNFFGSQEFLDFFGVKL